MNLTNTNPEFTRVAGAFGTLRKVRSRTSFRGVLEPFFTDWIHSHWGFHVSGWVRPAPKDFLKQKLPFDMPQWSRSRRVLQSNYTFSPIFHLTNAGNTWARFFQRNQPMVFPAFTTLVNTFEMNSMLSRDRLVENTQPTRELRNMGVGRDQQQILSARHTEIETTTHHIRTERDRVHKLISQLFSSVFKSVEPAPKYLVTLIRQLQPLTTSWMTPNLRLAQVARPFDAYLPDRSAAKLGPIEWLKTAPIVRRLEQSFLTLSNRFRIGGNSEFQSNFSTTVGLNLLSPKVAESDVIDRRIMHFISSPSLTYPKREQNFSERIIKALQDLRASQAETKVVIPERPSIERLTSEVRTQLEREIRIERERRGF